MTRVIPVSPSTKTFSANQNTVLPGLSHMVRYSIAHAEKDGVFPVPLLWKTSNGNIWLVHGVRRQQSSRKGSRTMGTCRTLRSYRGNISLRDSSEV